MPGKGKADIIKQIFADKDDLPAGKMKALEKFYWLLDEESAAHVKESWLPVQWDEIKYFFASKFKRIFEFYLWGSWLYWHLQATSTVF